MRKLIVHIYYVLGKLNPVGNEGKMLFGNRHLLVFHSGAHKYLLRGSKFSNKSVDSFGVFFINLLCLLIKTPPRRNNYGGGRAAGRGEEFSASYFLLS
jgi:hypothetical protein